MKKTYRTLLALGLVFCCTIPASALTIDLLELYDQNGSGLLEFGDNSTTKDNYEVPNFLSTVIRNFNLTQPPMSSTELSVFIRYIGDDSSADNYFAINGYDFAPLPNGNGSKTFVADSKILNQGANEIAFTIGKVSSYWGLDDFNITQFYLEYAPDQTPPQPVPEPGSLLLFGAGLLGIGVYRRLKK